MKPEEACNETKNAIVALIQQYTGQPFGTANVPALIALVHELAPPQNIYAEMLALLQKTPKEYTIGYRAIIYPDGSGHLEDRHGNEVEGSRFSRGQVMLNMIKKFTKSQRAVDIETVKQHLDQQNPDCNVTQAARRLLKELK